MSRLFPSDRNYCIPLVIGDDNSDVGSRLGGLAPAGIRPRHVTESTRYFCTIQIAKAPVLEASVFLSFNFSQMASNAGSIQSSGELFEAIVHGPSIRGNDSAFASELSPHPILYQSICEDHVVDDDGSRIIRSEHKLGGYPFIQDSGEGLPFAISELYVKGYFQVMQIDFPGAKDGPVNGNWPFAGGIVHFLGSEPLEESKWLCFWEY